ncbi:MAG: hypothetical protein NC079_09825 [Clostridium sp.]|nr:hypothetical protein [Acetatifactor muris]MCM1527797.1 hypothetical protein [Bacteroides sp.]MCM1563892.1 hypothetical protein [Clostridium sp.]
MVLPLFVFFLVNLGSAMEMIRLHGNLQMALWDVGSRMCVYGHVIGATDDLGDESVDGAYTGNGSAGNAGGADAQGKTLLQEMGDIALSYTYVKSCVVAYAGEEYLQASPLSHGVSGLQFWESGILGESGTDVEGILSGDVLDIVLTYQVSPWLDLPFVPPFRMSNRYYGRMWTGYELDTSLSALEQDVVYVAEHGEVYHERADCTHLQLSVREVSPWTVRLARNESGGRYQKCSKCGTMAYQGSLFIAREGDYYHYVRDCPGLKRTVHTIPRQQASQYRACSRCGQP